MTRTDRRSPRGKSDPHGHANENQDRTEECRSTIHFAARRIFSSEVVVTVAPFIIPSPETRRLIVPKLTWHRWFH
jgi:hypothetical protein